MSKNIKELRDGVAAVRYNPAAIQRLMYQELEALNQGNRDHDVVDPSNPFVFLMESSSIGASGAMVQAEALTRQQYPSMAMTEDEIYLHMSDKDFVGRFSTPARTEFIIMLSKEEFIQRAVKVEDSQTKKIVIPRHTEFALGDYTFTMQYPIEIRHMAHGGIQVMYDNEKPSPLQSIETNLLDWDVISIQGNEYLKITVPVNQFAIQSHFAKLSEASGYTKTFTFPDRYYYCRVYHTTSTGEWREIKTTHTDQVFDSTDPTVVLKVYENKVKVTVPHIFITNGRLNRELRIDVYSTKGQLDMVLRDYDVTAFSARFLDHDKEATSEFTAPLEVFSALSVFSDSVVVGGGNGLSFEEMRERVIMNSLGRSNLPITNVQLGAQLDNLGYTAIQDVDNLTNRVFLASRQLPKQQDQFSISSAGAFLGPMQATFKALANTDSVIDNGERITLTPDTLYQNRMGVIELLSDGERTQLLSLEGTALTDTVNSENYFYSPFHYVLDIKDDLFDVRAYYLDNPAISGRKFVQENDTAGLQIATGSANLVIVDGGYRLRVITSSGDLAKERPDEDFVVQLSFRPVGERRDVFLDGVLVGKTEGERIYEFDLQSTFDVDKEHLLYLDGFTMYPEQSVTYRTPLEGDFNIVYYGKNRGGGESSESEIDYVGAGFLLDDSYVGLIHEKIVLRFGWHLEGFWDSARSVPSSVRYSRYEEDVPARYEENEYETDPETGYIKVTLDDNGDADFNLLHEAGDIKRDVQGNPIIRHYKGDLIEDVDGNPIIEGEREILREFDIFLMDARYFFATNEATVAYRDSIPYTIVQWLLTDVAQFRSWALEQTEVYLYPQKTVGTVKAMVKEGETKTMSLDQSFDVTFYLSREKYEDGYLRQVLTETAIETINNNLANDRVSVSAITNQITARVGEDAIAVKVNGLGGEEDYTVATLEDRSSRFSIRKSLEMTADGSLAVVDDVNVVFLRHEFR